MGIRIDEEQIELLVISIKKLILMCFQNELTKDETFSNVQTMFHAVMEDVAITSGIETEMVREWVLEGVGELGDEEYIRGAINTIYVDGFIK